MESILLSSLYTNKTLISSGGRNGSTQRRFPTVGESRPHGEQARWWHEHPYRCGHTRTRRRQHARVLSSWSWCSRAHRQASQCHAVFESTRESSLCAYIATITITSALIVVIGRSVSDLLHHHHNDHDDRHETLAYLRCYNSRWFATRTPSICHCCHREVATTP